MKILSSPSTQKWNLNKFKLIPTPLTLEALAYSLHKVSYLRFVNTATKFYTT